MTRVAIIGMGRQAGTLAEGAVAAGAEVVAVYHPNPKRCDDFDGTFAGEHNIGDGSAFRLEGGVPTHHSLIGMLNKHQPDLAVVASPTWEHANQGITCLRAGVPTLVEKPWFGPQAVQAMLHTAREHDTLLYGAMPLPFWPPFSTVLEEVHSGKVGQLIGANFYRSTAFPWDNVTDLRGGGVDWDFNYHNTHFACLLTGQAPHEARGKQLRDCRTVPRQDGQVMAKAENKYTFRVSSTSATCRDVDILCSAEWKDEGADFEQGFFVRCATKHFAFKKDGYETRLGVAEWESHEFPEVNCYAAMMEHVIGCVREGRESNVVSLDSMWNATLATYYAGLSTAAGSNKLLVNLEGPFLF